MQFKLTKILLSFALTIAVSGCATQANRDPLEGVNRVVYKFNDVADTTVIKPVATAYKAITPSPVRTGVSNFFNNINTFISSINNLLQFKFTNAFTEAGRFVINSTFGVAGLIDVAGMDKVPVHKEDFGQTLGVWGVGNGAYLVLPILGPSTIRDGTGLLVDTLAFDPITYIHEPETRNVIRGIQFLDKRTQLLDAKDILDNASLDSYAFTRDAYLQSRETKLRDGDVQSPRNDGFEPADEEEPKANVAPTPAPAAAPADTK
jgi:phospholipid-binding lipoprotein MlaA